MGHECMGSIKAARKLELMANGEPVAPAKRMVTRYALQNIGSKMFLVVPLDIEESTLVFRTDDQRLGGMTPRQEKASCWEFMSGAEMAHFQLGNDAGHWEVVAISREVDEQAPDV